MRNSEGDSDDGTMDGANVSNGVEKIISRSGARLTMLGDGWQRRRAGFRELDCKMKLEGAGATAGAGMGVPALPLLGRCKVASAEPGQDALSTPACSQRQRVGFAPRRTNHSAAALICGAQGFGACSGCDWWLLRQRSTVKLEPCRQHHHSDRCKPAKNAMRCTTQSGSAHSATSTV